MRRTALYFAAWFAAGVTAVLLAGAGLGMVGQQVSGSRPAPLSAEQVREELPATSSTSSTTSTTASTTPTTAPATTSTTAGTTDGGTDGSPSTTTTAPAAAPTTRSYEMVGGTATVRFSAGAVTLVAATPKAGFTVDVGEGHSNGVRVEFEDEDHESRLDAWWDGGPQDEVREED